MSFGAPLMLLGLAGAAVPVLIHLLGRQRAPRVRFAAIDFVLRSNKRLARRLKLRQWVLLAARAALVGGLALMAAKPYTEAESDLPALGGGPQSVVLIVDDTMSMRWESSDGASLFARAIDRAHQLVRMLGGHSEIAVLSLSRPSGPLARLTRDARKVGAAVGQLRPSYLAATVGPALAQSRAILLGSSLKQRRVIVLTDRAAHGGVDAPERAGDDLPLHLVDVAKGMALDNRAVVDVRVGPSQAPGRHAVRLSARVCNHGRRALRVPVELEVDGRRAGGGAISLAAQACAVKPFEHAFERGGVHDVVVSIEPDALAADDHRYLRVEVQGELRVLLVNGGPSPIRHRDELFYLETALRTTSGSRPIAATTVTEDDLARVRFSAHDVVMLCNVRELPRRRAAELTAFVEKGGGLLISVGDNVNPASFNAALGKLLPQPLRGVGSTASLGGVGSALRIGRVDQDHPVIAALWSRRGGGLRSAAFHKFYRLMPAPTGGGRVVISFDDGSPALVEARRGAGRVMLLTSTLDRDWTDLPIRPGYLPLVQQIARYLSRAMTERLSPSALVGETRQIPIEPAYRQLRLMRPEGQESSWAAAELQGKTAIEVVARAPGFYRVSATSTDGAVRQLERASFAANVDPRESDLRRGHVGEQRAEGGKATVVKAKRKVELWHGLGVALLGLLLFEAFLTRRAP